MKIKKKIAFAALIAIAAVSIGYIGYFVYNQYWIPHQSDKEVDSMRDVYVIETEEEEEETAPTVSFEVDENGNLIKNMNNKKEDEPVDSGEAATDSDSDKNSQFSESIEKVRELNGNIKAWVYLNGTTIDYPVVQAGDNDYYLTHDHNGRYTVNGAIFMDYRCDTDSQNIVIYGHHMNANVMFSGLVDMKNKNFAQNHSSLYLDIGDGGTKYWDIIAAFACREKEAEKFQKFTFTPDSIKEFLSDIRNTRYFEIGPEFGETNQYVTLITCSYEYSDARTVVIARRR